MKSSTRNQHSSKRLMNDFFSCRTEHTLNSFFSNYRKDFNTLPLDDLLIIMTELVSKNHEGNFLNTVNSIAANHLGLIRSFSELTQILARLQELNKPHKIINPYTHFLNKWSEKALTTRNITRTSLLQSANSKELAQTIFSLAELNYRNQDFLVAWLSKAQQSFTSFNGEELTLSLKGFSKLNPTTRQFIDAWIPLSDDINNSRNLINNAFSLTMLKVNLNIPDLSDKINLSIMKFTNKIQSFYPKKIS